MTSHAGVMCSKSVGTDLSMLDIDDLITEIFQLKKEVALLEAKLRARGDQLNTEVWTPQTILTPISLFSSCYIQSLFDG